MDEEKSSGILPSLQKLLDKKAQRQKRQREYYAEKGKEVRRKYYLANIEEKRRASREYPPQAQGPVPRVPADCVGESGRD